jgi:hypothetical protein
VAHGSGSTTPIVIDIGADGRNPECVNQGDVLPMEKMNDDVSVMVNNQFILLGVAIESC